MKRFNSKGVPIAIEDMVFTNGRRKEKKHGCFHCGKKGQSCDGCPILAKELKKARKQRRKGEEEKAIHKALTSIGEWVEIDEKPRKPPSTKSSSSS